MRIQFQGGASKPPSDKDIEPLKAMGGSRVHQGNQANVVGVRKCAVIGGQAHGDLEFPRQ